MTANEARKLAFENSKRMNAIYEDIRKSALRGNSSVYLNTGMASAPELEILKANGFTYGYETSEIDGGQMLLVKW